MKPLTTTKDLLSALSIIDKFGFKTKCITDIQLIEASYKTLCNIIRFSYDYSEKDPVQWYGEYFTKAGFMIIKYISPDIYYVMYGSSKGINKIECESKEQMDSLYNEIRTEELIECYHDLANYYSAKTIAEELELDFDGKNFHL